MSETAICPCDTFIHPAVISNVPGQQTITYRAGDFLTFRQALLLPLPSEAQLSGWRPGAEGDLAVQMVEWWAYLADILTFYNERIANESYLRTAQLPESVNRLIRLLGYRPRPGIGATGVLAALASGTRPFIVPRGFQIQSKPGPGKQPQIFELDADTLVTPSGAVDADPPANTTLSVGAVNSSLTVLVKGTVTSVKPGDELLLLPSNWDGKNVTAYALLSVDDTALIKDPRGTTNTQLTMTVTRMSGIPTNTRIADYRLLRSTLSVGPWPYTCPTASDNNTLNGVIITSNQIHLSQITRQIEAGDVMLLEIAGAPSAAPSPTPEFVTSYAEVVWFANPQTCTDPSTPQTGQNIPPPIPIPHTLLSFQPDLSTGWAANRSQVRVRYAWQPVGELVPMPASSAEASLFSLSAAGELSFLVGTGEQFLLEDANGNGAIGTGTVVSPGTSLDGIQLTQLPDPPATLATPLRVLFNTLVVSRGKTVAREILGSGDASQSGQGFVLQNAPLTYLQSVDSTSGDQYSSTLRVWVDGVEWQEVPSFYGQSSSAHIFVTREDEQARTHVQFGDGVNGTRLPTGVNNVLARYRYGSGADAPSAGSLTVIPQPQPNLKAIRNPVPVGGGADPDAQAKSRRLAPRSVLTFGRAISADDYETIAAQAPGVTRAKAYWTWDDDEQRSLVTVYVGDTAAAVVSATKALVGADDPNRPVQVSAAQPLSVRLTLSLVLDRAYLPDPLKAAVRAALLDPDVGLFGTNVIGIGQSIYDSQIEAACLAVPGTRAVHTLTFAVDDGTGNFQPDPAVRHDPGEGSFYQLVSVEGLDNAG